MRASAPLLSTLLLVSCVLFGCTAHNLETLPLPPHLQVYANVSKTYGAGVSPYVWNNLLVKDILSFNVTVCANDSRCSAASVFVAVTPNASLSNGPIINGINTKVGEASTRASS